MQKITLFIIFSFIAIKQLKANPSLQDSTVQADFIFENACIYQSVIFTDLSSGPITSWNWDFDNGEGVSNEQDPEFTFGGSGVFEVRLIVSNDLFSDTIYKEIHIYDAIPTYQDTVVCNNETVTFNGVEYSEFVGTPTVFNYIDTLVSSQGCDSISILRMTVNPCGCEFTFPNLFTPNGDGINDTYGPVVVCDLPVINYWMIVYDRWGETVFETYEHSEAWNGQINGFDLTTDVYMVWVQYEIEDDDQVYHVSEVKDITLIR